MRNTESEVHPSFGKAIVSRVSTTGTNLFDSDIRHREYISLRIHQASRRRDLAHDWIHQERELIEINMSMAQWGALVSSMGSDGVPVTISHVNGQRIEQADHAPRMRESVAEVKAAATKSVAEIDAATKAVIAGFDAKVGRKEMSDLIRTLRYTVENAPGSMAFAATSLTEHVEKVITTAKADIEAMVAAAADHHGVAIEATDVRELLS